MAVFLVTGGAGFIGSSLVEALVERGDEVRVFDNFSTGRLTNLLRVRDKIEIVQGDLGNRELLGKAAQGVDCVFHFATPSTMSNDNLDDVTEGWAHCTNTLNVLTVSRNSGVRRVIYASTGSMYGHP